MLLPIVNSRPTKNLVCNLIFNLNGTVDGLRAELGASLSAWPVTAALKNSKRTQENGQYKGVFDNVQ